MNHANLHHVLNKFMGCIFYVCLISWSHNIDLNLFCSTVQNWDTVIPRNDDDLVPLGVNSRDVDSVGDALQVHVKTGIALLTHFLDRGLYSGHVFATSNLNHRDLDVGHWNSTETRRPRKMTDCLINPDGAKVLNPLDSLPSPQLVLQVLQCWLCTEV